MKELEINILLEHFRINHNLEYDDYIYLVSKLFINVFNILNDSDELLIDESKNSYFNILHIDFDYNDIIFGFCDERS